MEDIMGPGKNTNQFRQAMGVTVIGLVKVFLLMKKTWLLEPPVGTMGWYMCLRCRMKHGQKIKY